MKAVRAGATVIVTTPHFSDWPVFSWDPFAKWARNQIDRIYAQTAQGKQPSCEGQDQLAGRGVEVSSNSGPRVMWCAGTKAGTTFLKVVNTRGYTMRLEYTAGLKLEHGSTAGILAPALASMVEQPSKRGNKVTTIGSAEELEFNVTATGDVGVALAPSPAAMLVTAAEFAARTVGEVSKFLGVEVGTIVRSADAIGCIQGLAKHFTGSPGNAVELNDYLINSIDTSFGCFENTMKQQMGFIGGSLVSGFTWVLAGVTTAANSLGAAADTLFNPKPYQVTITTTAAAQEPSSDSVSWDVSTWEIGWGRFGPYNVGMTGKSAVEKGLSTYKPEVCDFRWADSARIRRLFGDRLFTEWRGGKSLDKLDLVATKDRRVTTEQGNIRVGDPRSKVQKFFSNLGPYSAFLSEKEDDLVAYCPDGYAILFDFDSFSLDAPVRLITATRGNRTDGPDPFVGGVLNVSARPDGRHAQCTLADPERQGEEMTIPDSRDYGPPQDAIPINTRGHVVDLLTAQPNGSSDEDERHAMPAASGTLAALASIPFN